LVESGRDRQPPLRAFDFQTLPESSSQQRAFASGPDTRQTRSGHGRPIRRIDIVVGRPSPVRRHSRVAKTIIIAANTNRAA
jgi:hypothetical protein